MTFRLLVLAVALVSLFPGEQAAAIEPTTVARRIEPSMVRVMVEGPYGALGGSG